MLETDRDAEEIFRRARRRPFDRRPMFDETFRTAEARCLREQLESTDEGERLSVLGEGFAEGRRPQGRCAQLAVTFEIAESNGDRQATNVAPVEEAAPRRARLRSRGGSR